VNFTLPLPLLLGDFLSAIARLNHMRRTLALLLLLSVTSAGPAFAQQPAPPPPAKVALVDFASQESMTRLARAEEKVDFFHLAEQFEGQVNGGYCGPASAVIVMNAIRYGNDAVEKPRDTSSIPAELAALIPKQFDPFFHRYTQTAFFDAQTDTVKTREQLLGKPAAPGARPDPGMQLRQLHEILRAHGLESELRVADDKLTDAQIRKELIANLGTEGDYVIVNIHRSALGQVGGGHLSPLGAYDQKSDSFLMLDVNAAMHQWTWVPADALIKAMRTHDTVENRGYVLVKEGKK
jgi:hypothetical protein